MFYGDVKKYITFTTFRKKFFAREFGDGNENFQMKNGLKVTINS